MELTEHDVLSALRCASELLDRRRLSAIGVPGWLDAHYQRMRTLSARGHQKAPPEPQLGHDDVLDTQQVADMLNTSPRQIRRIAAKLGGQKIGRDWIFDRAAVQEHTRGKAGS